MPLALTLTMADRLFVGDQVLRLIKLGPGRRASLRVDGKEVIEIADEGTVELVPGVRIGLIDRTKASVRIHMTAPRSIPVHRVKKRPGLEDP